MVLPTASSLRKRALVRKWPIATILLAMMASTAPVGVFFLFDREQLASNDAISSITMEQSNEWAYVFLLADCNPTVFQPSYRGLLYNIMAATYVLKYRDDSPADVVVLVQMAHSSPTNRLTKAEEDLLQHMQINFRYLPQPSQPTSTFYQLVMAKFYVLQMVEYRKVMFLDSDVLPLCTLDYLLQLSQDGILGDTIVHAMYEDPINAGLFVVTPRRHLHDELLRRWNEFRDASSKPPVDYVLWDGTTGSGWDFYCGDSDQGFLLYSLLFVMQSSASLIVGSKIQQYDACTPVSVIPRREYRRPTDTLSTEDVLSPHSCLTFLVPSWAQNASPRANQLGFYRDFFHMVGYSKVWESPITSWNADMEVADLQSSRDYWFYCLQQMAQRFDPDHTVIPFALDRLHELVNKPKLRGDLFFAPP